MVYFLFTFSRYNNETLKVLESELCEMKSNRNEICFESKNIINYVRSWLQEQKKINEYVSNKERNYCLTIEKLKHANQYVIELNVFCMT